VLLWVAGGLLDREASATIELDADAVFVSAASIWEIEIKRALGRLSAPPRIGAAAREAGYEALPINFDHATAAGELPPIHGDPFDRMLVAQARVEGLTLATADRQLQRYDVPTLAVDRG
jgi:PIN domain nuclease of toxin-antitoxin system